MRFIIIAAIAAAFGISIFAYLAGTNKLALDATFWTMVSAWATVFAVVVASQQILDVRSENLKERTLNACLRYDLDPIICEASDRLARARRSGDLLKNPTEHQIDLITTFNYFESIAIGVERGLYDPRIVQDQLRPIIVQACKYYFRPELFEGHESGNDLKSDYSALVGLARSWGDEL